MTPTDVVLVAAASGFVGGFTAWGVMLLYFIVWDKQ